MVVTTPTSTYGINDDGGRDGHTGDGGDDGDFSHRECCLLHTQHSPT